MNIMDEMDTMDGHGRSYGGAEARLYMDSFIVGRCSFFGGFHCGGREQGERKLKGGRKGKGKRGKRGFRFVGREWGGKKCESSKIRKCVNGGFRFVGRERGGKKCESSKIRKLRIPL